MGERSADERAHVIVGERVENVFSLATPPHQTFDAQNFEALRDGRHSLAQRGRELAHARFAGAKKREQPQPLHVAGRTKEARRGSERVVGLYLGSLHHFIDR
jgi:hypothetical protein